MDNDKLVELAVQTATVVGTVAGALLPVLVPVFGGLIRGWVKNTQLSQAAESVGGACLVAASYAITELHRAQLKAMDPASPGGTAVTPDERRAALTAAVAVGMNYLKDHNVMAKAVEAYGGEDAVRRAVEAAVVVESRGM